MGGSDKYGWFVKLMEDVEYFGVSDFERNWNPEGAFFDTFHRLWWLPISIVLCYLSMILIFNKPAAAASSRPRGPPKARPFEAAWNLFLAAFSTYGAIRVVPRLLHDIFSTTLFETICIPKELQHTRFAYGPCGFWIMLFCVSKIPELFDTVILLLKGRHVIFLHWYHHSSVLLYCWHAYVTTAPAGVWFGSMNLVIHAIMYYYYFLTAIGQRPKWDFLLTTLQIAQMIVGVAITIISIIYFNDCHGLDVGNLAFASLMYLTYLALFCSFFIDKYITKGKRFMVHPCPGREDGSTPLPPAASPTTSSPAGQPVRRGKRVD